MICPKCNKELEDGKKFCTSCGTKLNTETPSEITKEPVKESTVSKSYKINPFFILTGVVEIFILVTWFLATIHTGVSNGATMEGIDTSANYLYEDFWVINVIAISTMGAAILFSLLYVLNAMAGKIFGAVIELVAAIINMSLQLFIMVILIMGASMMGYSGEIDFSFTTIGKTALITDTALIIMLIVKIIILSKKKKKEIS